METLLNSYSIPLAILIRIVSCFVLVVYLIPLQVREAGVSNGLRLLRIQLLVAGLVLLFTNIVSIAFLFLALKGEQQPINDMLQVVNAIAFLVLSIITKNVYRTQYTDEAKDIHDKVDRAEKRAKIIKGKASVKAKEVLETAKAKAEDLLKNPKS